MTTRDQLKQLITPGDRFPAPTMPVSGAVKIIFMSGAVDAIPAETDNTRRFMVVEQSSTPRRPAAACPIQLEGPFRARRKALRLRPAASMLLCALVAIALKGG